MASTGPAGWPRERPWGGLLAGSSAGGSPNLGTLVDEARLLADGWGDPVLGGTEMPHCVTSPVNAEPEACAAMRALLPAAVPQCISVVWLGWTARAEDQEWNVSC